MSVTNLYECCCRGGLSVTPSIAKLFFRSSALLSVALSPPKLHFPKYLPSSQTCSTCQGFSKENHFSWNSGPVLCSHDKERARRSLQSRHLGTLKHPILGHNVSSGRFPRRSSGEEAAGRVDEEETSNCLYLKKTIRNGEIVEHSGTVIILGDVEPGGHVLADGDVIVLGRLQGRVHAGRAGGAFTSRIFATTMEPRELQICDSAAFTPENSDQTQVPKMAVLSTASSIGVFPAAEESAERQTAPVNRTGMSRKLQTQQIGDVRNQRPAQVALVTGIYISVAGIALLGFPKVLFGSLFDLQGVKLGWIRVGAVLAVVFGVYYIGTAVGDMRGMNGAKAFYFSTVVGRTFLFFSFSWLVLIGAVPSPLFLVGTMNLVGAMAMLKALLGSPAKSSG